MTDRAADISKLLRDLETEHRIEILYACESGSRAWGFASPDSDYDIRFLYRRPITESFSIGDSPDTIECPIEDDLDPAGWAIGKALRLLRKSNGALIEWLHSPAIYEANSAFLSDLRQLTTDHLCQKSLANHYRGLANQIFKGRIEQEEAPTGKAYLYALRAVLCTEHVLQTSTPPPVAFTELLRLLPANIRQETDQLLLWKEEAGEKASPGKLPLLDYFLARSIAYIAEQISKLNESVPPLTPFDKALHGWTLWPATKNTQLSPPTFRKSDFTLERVCKNDLLLFECVSGSRSFGTHHEKSDYDLRGVFVAPPSFLCGLESIDQVSDEKSDEVYYELGRFISLLSSNNPNLIELLFTPDFCLRKKNPAFDLITPDLFLSKLCEQTFGNYAMGQIRKARGLNKKIVNPQPEQRHPLRHFCHILLGQGSVPLSDWLLEHGYQEEHCALVAVNHATNTYALFHDPDHEKDHQHQYRGLFSKKDDSTLLCSSVPKEAQPIAWMHGNLDAFKAHCKSHREYWQWVKERNEDRYATNTAHGHGYDSKNLMHTLRLLDQAKEIAQDHRITLPRENADWLKKVKSGHYSYEDLLTIAEEKNTEMVEAFQSATLPDKPDPQKIAALLLEIRDRFSHCSPSC